MSKEFNKKESVSYPHGQETLRAMNRTKQKRFGCKATKNLPIIAHHSRNHSHTGKKYSPKRPSCQANA